MSFIKLVGHQTMYNFCVDHEESTKHAVSHLPIVAGPTGMGAILYVLLRERGGGFHGDQGKIVASIQFAATVAKWEAVRAEGGKVIDLAEIRWSDAVIPNFAGVFDGNGHIIRRAVIDAPDNHYDLRGLPDRSPHGIGQGPG